MVKEITIKNYKSVYSAFMELGRVNVLIGPNGVGKSNLLEAIAVFSAEREGAICLEDLIGKGVRIAKPQLTVGSFYGRQSLKTIEGSLKGDAAGKLYNKIYKLVCEDWGDIYSDWVNDYRNHPLMNIEHFIRNSVLLGGSIKSSHPELNTDSVDGQDDVLSTFKTLKRTFEAKEKKPLPVSNYTEIARKHLSGYVIYSPFISALRGFTHESKMMPMGLHGEGFDLLVASLNAKEQQLLFEYACRYIPWLQNIIIEEGNQFMGAGYRLSRSNSTLFFVDRLMLKKNSMISVESVDEGTLRVLFYLALFISHRTPSFFALENLDAGLHPSTCYQLMKDLARLAKLTDKQVLITTTSPELLDSLNMDDPDLGLFSVSRADDGQTEINKIHFTREELDAEPLSARFVQGDF